MKNQNPSIHGRVLYREVDFNKAEQKTPLYFCHSKNYPHICNAKQ